MSNSYLLWEIMIIGVGANIDQMKIALIFKLGHLKLIALSKILWCANFAVTKHTYKNQT